MELFLDPQNIGRGLDVIGTIFIAYAALRVHHRVLAEHHIDKKVLKSMVFEQIVGWTGVVLLIIGYFVTIFS